MQLLLSTIFFTFLLSFSHPFYVSICEMHHNSKAETIEITLKIFTDDLEETLEARTTERLFLGAKNENKKTDTLLLTYINNNFHIDVNNKRVQYDFIGKEAEIESTWIYLEVKDVPDIATIKVENRLLFDFKDEQMNIVHLKVDGKKKSLLLNRNEEAGELEF